MLLSGDSVQQQLQQQQQQQSAGLLTLMHA
jgi:hypothetical protein